MNVYASEAESNLQRKATVSFDVIIQILSVVGTWIGGLGSLAAAIVALWLARKNERFKVKAFVDIKQWIDGVNPREEFLLIRITNGGIMPIKIVYIGWRVRVGGEWRKAAQQFLDPRSYDYPKILHYGETADFNSFFSNSDWINCMASGLLKDASIKEIKTLRLKIETSLGHVKLIVPSERVFERLVDARVKTSNNRNLAE